MADRAPANDNAHAPKTTPETAGHMNRTGTFLGVPYDWRRPTRARFKQRVWNPDDSRLFTARWFGWGYDINFARLLRRRSPSQISEP